MVSRFRSAFEGLRREAARIGTIVLGHEEVDGEDRSQRRSWLS